MSDLFPGEQAEEHREAIDLARRFDKALSTVGIECKTSGYVLDSEPSVGALIGGDGLRALVTILERVAGESLSEFPDTPGPSENRSEGSGTGSAPTPFETFVEAGWEALSRVVESARLTIEPLIDPEPEPALGWNAGIVQTVESLQRRVTELERTKLLLAAHHYAHVANMSERITANDDRLDEHDGKLRVLDARVAELVEELARSVYGKPDK